MSLNSLLRLSCSKPVNLPSRNSNIALACNADSLYFLPLMPTSFGRSSGLQASSPTFLRIADSGPASQSFLHNSSAATFGSFDLLIIEITSSILAIDTINPSTIWPLSLAFLRSYFVLLIITSFLCSIKASRISFKLTSFGWPFDKTVKLIPKDCSS